MEYTKLGRTGLDVSRICLGCMSYGGGKSGNHAWSLPEEESRPFIKKAPHGLGLGLLGGALATAPYYSGYDYGYGYAPYAGTPAPTV